MKRTSVSSTMIRSVGYSAKTKSLEIEFNKGGAVWLYAEFPPEEHEAFMAADSAGRFFLARIKGAYLETKL